MTEKTHSAPTPLWVIVAVILTSGIGAYSFYWVKEEPCTRVEVRGLSAADTSEVLALAFPTNGVYKADLVADRIRRHPWVFWSAATCYPNGLLDVEVKERIPVLMVVDSEGRASHFMDSGGFMMPAREGQVFDVPLLRDQADTYHPVHPVEDPEIRALAGALAITDKETERLFSEFTVTPRGITLYTQPALTGESLEVWLGREQYATRFERFRAFWDQRVVAGAPRTYEWIDLRFEGQVVTSESVRKQYTAT